MDPLKHAAFEAAAERSRRRHFSSPPVTMTDFSDRNERRYATSDKVATVVEIGRSGGGGGWLLCPP